MGQPASLSLHRICKLLVKEYLRLIVQPDSYLTAIPMRHSFQFSITDTKASSLEKDRVPAPLLRQRVFNPNLCSLSSTSPIFKLPIQAQGRIPSTVRWCKDQNHCWRHHGVSRPNSKYRIEYRLGRCSLKWR